MSFDPFYRLFIHGASDVAKPGNEVNRRYDNEVAVVHAALVELGVSEPNDNAAAKAVVKLNRLCGRSGAQFEGALRALSTLCNDAPLLIERLTPAAKASVAAAVQDDDDDDDSGDDE